jgi:hypothetical protein
METATDLAVRLSRASVKKLWDPYTDIEWPETLDSSLWFLPPELMSLYGTEAWEALDDEKRRRLSLFELANFFSLTLQGERPLVQGLVNQMYSRQNADVTEYIHHFLDEENKHMVMFAEFCKRYAGKVYSYKKLILPKDYAKGEEDVTFFIKALIVEELGDVYNVEMGKDARLHPIVREVNNIHHSDEARHIIFGRRLLQEAFAKWSQEWPVETLAGLRAWLGEYLRSSWADFYNPAMYRDAGIADAYDVRTRALEAEVCRAHRRLVSSKLVGFFLETGILLEEPAL